MLELSFLTDSRPLWAPSLPHRRPQAKCDRVIPSESLARGFLRRQTKATSWDVCALGPPLPVVLARIVIRIRRALRLLPRSWGAEGGCVVSGETWEA